MSIANANNLRNLYGQPFSPKWPSLLEIGPQNLDDSLEVLLAVLSRSLRDYVLAQVAFQDFGHQTIYRTADRRYLLQDPGTFGFISQRLLQRLGLSPDAADSGYQWLLIANGVGHSFSFTGLDQILGCSIAFLLRRTHAGFRSALRGCSGMSAPACICVALIYTIPTYIIF